MVGDSAYDTLERRLNQSVGSGLLLLASKPMRHEYKEIKFADQLVIAVLDGDKQATVRYGGFEDVEVGDKLIATTTEGSPFATLEVTRTATVQAVEVHDILNVIGANYSSETPEDVIDGVNKYYSDQIGPSTNVRVLVFNVIQHE